MNKLCSAWKKNYGQVFLHIALILISVLYILPLLLVVSASFSDEEALLKGGFSLLPRGFTFDSYRVIFEDASQILNSYKTTAIYSIGGTALSILVMSMMAYPLTRPNFKFRKAVNFMVLFTMLFSGGLVPSYIINTRYLHLGNTIWIYILPGVVSAYNLFVIKAGYKSISEELIEAARIDGANEFYICFKIMMPLAKATLATVAFLILVAKWNDWYTSSVYIQNPNLYSLQYLLQRILNETEYMKQMALEGMAVIELKDVMPSESLRYAMAIIAAGPMLIVFPLFQKYFVKGMTIGAVKG